MTPKTKRKTASKRSKKDAKARTMYSLRLYITGQTPRSVDSVSNLQQVCKEHLSGRFELEVIDIYQQPELARQAQIIAAPTLIKSLPPPFRRLVGDLSNRERVLIGLDLRSDGG